MNSSALSKSAASARPQDSVGRRLAGKTALITGGNSGIGLAAAKLFHAHGARLIITGRDTATLEQAQEGLGDDAVAIQSNTGRVADIEKLMQVLAERFGSIDVLFVNAAAEKVAPFEAVTEEHFDESTAVNFKGAFFTIQKALPLLSPGASVIVTTSIANEVGAPNFSVYAACKAALRSLVRTLSLELIARGIRVNAVSPGPIDTPGFGRWGVSQEMVEAARADFASRSPMKRFGLAEEVAQAALFLASSESSYVVGAELVVDGGLSQLL
jgi:NAD(P)-dependent dehydrogenase (short-subunit alcohol dehydrogenase family)